MCLGVEPRAAGWKVQTNPLSYGGTCEDNCLCSLNRFVRRMGSSFDVDVASSGPSARPPTSARAKARTAEFASIHVHLVRLSTLMNNNFTWPCPIYVFEALGLFRPCFESAGTFEPYYPMCHLYVKALGLFRLAVNLLRPATDRLLRFEKFEVFYIFAMPFANMNLQLLAASLNEH